MGVRSKDGWPAAGVAVSASNAETGTPWRQAGYLWNGRPERHKHIFFEKPANPVDEFPFRAQGG